MNDGTPIRPAVGNVELGASSEEFQNLHEFVRKARANLNQNAWDYIVGAAETETTLRRNRMALDEIAFRPRVLRDVSRVDASVERFGRKMRLPVVLAPVGVRMFQLYVRGDDAFVEDHVSRAIACRYAAFCLTVDTAHYSRRERDIAKRYVR